MTNELQRVLDKLGVKVKAKDLAGIPARGFAPGFRAWRVTLSRTVGRGKDAKEFKLSTAYFTSVNEVPYGGTEPKAYEVAEALMTDATCADMTLWDFAQELGHGKPNDETERLHKACKRIAPRAKRFFGVDAWASMTGADNAPSSSDNVAKRVKKSA